ESCRFFSIFFSWVCHFGFSVFAVVAEKVNPRGCANLTLVLDNWKYAIMTQVKDLLLHDHSTVLPDYGRIQPLSDALGDLYKEFNSLKERLGELTSKFEGVEAFVDDVRSGRSPAPPRGEPRPLGMQPGDLEATAHGGPKRGN
uniref:Si:ch73-127m5.3 n=1 Tax=Myripristis murdjan TaxID=586833 RepID=A0A667ZIS9_9TELE